MFLNFNLAQKQLQQKYKKKNYVISIVTNLEANFYNKN